MDERKPTSPGHEAATLDLRRLAMGALVILAGVAIASLAAWGLWKQLGLADSPRPPTLHEAPPVTAAAPAEQVEPEAERRAYFAEKQRRLTAWGWVDARAGVAHIPIDEAMRILAVPGGDRPSTATETSP
jgi:hypothetical protein